MAYWYRGTLCFYNYATRRLAASTPFICGLLDACHEWQTVRDLARHLNVDASPGLLDLVERLVGLTLLERAGDQVDPHVKAMSSLATWNPEAGFFHMATRDVAFNASRGEGRWGRQQDLRGPMPSAVKRYRRAPQVVLPPPEDSDFARTLKARRTFRRYSSVPIDIGQLGTLLGLTVGIQVWAETEPRPAALKTSPSGGARHPIECYVVCRDVKGLRPGIYHYAADVHHLERLRGPVSVERMRSYVPHSGYFARASVMVFFTAVFERILWRYPYSRAYRAALIEAGHVCQTFLLTATALGLAPYCVMGLADSVIEEDLGLDGITESVLYCAGVGRPPRGTAWAPLTRGTIRTRPNPRLARK